jgi:glucose/galactose transporter
MGICNKVAGALAPLLLIHLITNSDDEIDLIQQQLPSLSAPEQLQVMNDLASRLILPYLCMALVLMVLGLMIRYSHLPDVQEPEDEAGASEKKSIFQFPHLILGAITIFCGVSVEVLAVDSVIGYAQYNGLAFKDAKYFATITLFFMIISYLIGTLTIPRYIQQRRMLQIIAVMGLIFTTAALLLQGSWSVWSIALLGFANALLWPSIWPLALVGLGKFTKQASALLIMGVVGGALTPLLYGALSDAANPQLAYVVLLPCYLFILFYASKGYKSGLS